MNFRAAEPDGQNRIVSGRRIRRAESDHQPLKLGLFTGQVKPHGLGRVGPGELTRIDPRKLRYVLTRPDPTREILKPPDPTGPDPRDFTTF